DDCGTETVSECAVAPGQHRDIRGLAVRVAHVTAVAVQHRLRWQRCPSFAAGYENRNVGNLQSEREFDGCESSKTTFDERLKANQTQLARCCIGYGPGAAPGRRLGTS